MLLQLSISSRHLRGSGIATQDRSSNTANQTPVLERKDQVKRCAHTRESAVNLTILTVSRTWSTPYHTHIRQNLGDIDCRRRQRQRTKRHLFLLNSSVVPTHCVQLFLRQLRTMIGNVVESQTRVIESLSCTCHCRGRRRTLPLLLRPCLQERTETTTVIFLIGYAWFRNVHYGTRPSVHETTNFR